MVSNSNCPQRHFVTGPISLRVVTNRSTYKPLVRIFFTGIKFVDPCGCRGRASMRATAAGAKAPFKERTERCMRSSLPRPGCSPGTCTGSATGRPMAMAIAESARRTCWRAPCGDSQVLVEGK